MSSVRQTLEDLMEVGWNCNNSVEYEGWRNRVSVFLREAFGAERSRDFGELYDRTLIWKNSLQSQIGMLEGLESKLASEDAALKSVSLLTTAVSQATSAPQSKKVFVVHGHDTEVKEAVARFLERLGLQPIILHEQANEGRTVIEKFEKHSEVGFAVVLLTPDDVGAAKDDRGNLKPRARQNVVLELGYFLGKLRRSHVCALYKAGVEIPSDYQGVLYVELDSRGSWRHDLAQELSNAGLQIDLKALLT